MSESSTVVTAPEPELTLEQWAALPEDEPGELVDGRLDDEEVPDIIHEAVVSWFRGTQHGGRRCTLRDHGNRTIPAFASCGASLALASPASTPRAGRHLAPYLPAPEHIVQDEGRMAPRETPMQRSVDRDVSAGSAGRGRPLLAALPALLVGCSLLFQFSPLRVEEKDEVRLPPPPHAPLFTDAPRHDPTPAAAHRFGAAIAAGHFSRERAGRPDVELAVGVPGVERGRGYVVRQRKAAAGDATEILLPATYGVEAKKAQFGAALAAGDFDHDRFDDLAIGAPGDGAGGSVVVVYGGGARWTRLTPPAAAGRRGFGTALAAADLDGDDRADLVIGEPGESRAGGGDPARVWIVWGQGGGALLAMADSTALGVPFGDEQGNATRFGQSLAIGNFALRPDASQPVRPDLAVGAPAFDRSDLDRRDVGRVYVFRPAGPDPRTDGFTLAVTLEPRDGWERYAKQFGFALAGGNFNGDAEGPEPRDDLAIGAPKSSIPEHDDLGSTVSHPSGKARNSEAGLVFIAPHVLAAVSPELRVLSQDRMGLSQKGDHFGWALATGDFNCDGNGCDGLDDLVIGSPNERMAGVDVSGAKQAGALYVRFGVPGAWNVGGGIPQIPAGCFDYIDAVRGQAEARKGDRFGTVLVAARFDDDEALDLLVGAPETDVALPDGVVRDAGAVWVGRNQATTAGPFDGVFTGSFRDDACGGAAAAGLTLDVRNREGAVCGRLTTARDLCFEVEGEAVRVGQIDVDVIATDVGLTAMHLEYVVRNEDDDTVGSLFVDAEVPDALGDLTVDLTFRGSGIERSASDLVLDRQ